LIISSTSTRFGRCLPRTIHAPSRLFIPHLEHFPRQQLVIHHRQTCPPRFPRSPQRSPHRRTRCQALLASVFLSSLAISSSNSLSAPPDMSSLLPTMPSDMSSLSASSTSMLGASYQLLLILSGHHRSQRRQAIRLVINTTQHGNIAPTLPATRHQRQHRRIRRRGLRSGLFSPSLLITIIFDCHQHPLTWPHRSHAARRRVITVCIIKLAHGDSQSSEHYFKHTDHKI
jgi:hypothetical protein